MTWPKKSSPWRMNHGCASGMSEGEFWQIAPLVAKCRPMFGPDVFTLT
jgi:hypothetical protein